jgi:hypothetical protein
MRPLLEPVRTLVERTKTRAQERPIALIQGNSRENAQKTQKYICFCAFCAFSRLF